MPKKRDYKKDYHDNKERCLEAQRRYRSTKHYKENILPRQKERSKIWYQKNKEKRYAYNRKWWQNQIEKQEKMLGRKKPNVCEICGENNFRIVFDHCHETQKPRGWLCNRCNVVLGKVKDDKELLQKIINYLR